MYSILQSVVVLLGISRSVLGAAIRRSPYPFPSNETGGHESMRIMASTPQLDYDPKTTSYCTWWYDNSQTTNCDDLLSREGITLANFRRWNPSIDKDCSNLNIGHSYCIEAAFEPTPTEPEDPPAATSSAPSNGIETPLPTQPKIVGNCDAFYLVQSGDSCAAIASSHGLTMAQFLEWNPAAGTNCAGLWADAYACVSIIGHEPTPTKPDNGITTPLPPQPSMVDDCDAFYLVQSGDTCAAIASSHGISLAQFLSWNRAAGSNCAGLWADAYACVSIIGHEPAPPTPTKPANGIETPSPVQNGMTPNCRSFHFVESGQTCAAIATQYRVSVSDLIQWNPAVGPGCAGMWANTYLCVGLL